MAILRSPLLPLGLLLCLWLLCSPASCTNPSTQCKPFSWVTAKKPSVIHINPDVYKSNTLYTVSTHVSHDIISVVLEARDQYHLVTGSWQNPSHYCEGRAEYDLKGNFSTLFEAKWMSSNSTDITAVKINIYSLNSLRRGELTSIILPRNGTPSPVTIKQVSTKHIITTATHKPTLPHPKPTPPHPKPTTAQEKTTTTHPKTTNTLPKTTTTQHTLHPKLTTTHKSSANRAFLSPVREAIQILLIFLTSTLLF
ncbi:placenta-expressed transcript 1 protein-like [Budorcas taxicolor]|uniref:placenta-expressed transcript 1 protein-like n=1 Tax=Budorcas taxicolor TaxID=37181 RepID=UPI0022849E91|nr:placenta-expressed transcript 1 protein-like [Budorcas taxicolor]